MWRFLGDRKKKPRAPRAAAMKKKKTTPPKMSGLVLAALRNLRDARGSTAKEIMKYIMAEYNASEATVQRQLKTALKRGVEYGILKKTPNGYSLNTDAEVIGPFDITAQVDACKKPCPKPKRKCKKKKKACPPKRKPCNPCAKKKKKKNPCNVCSTRGRKSDCNAPVRLLSETSAAELDDVSAHTAESEKRSMDGEAVKTDAEEGQRSRSVSKCRPTEAESRSPSMAQSQSDEDEEDF